MENQELQDKLTGQMLAVMQEKGYEGVDIDFEYILPENREQYARFVARVRKTMMRIWLQSNRRRRAESLGPAAGDPCRRRGLCPVRTERGRGISDDI